MLWQLRTSLRVIKASRQLFSSGPCLCNAHRVSLRRSLASDAQQSCHKPNQDTHQPEVIQYRWQPLWQQKLKEYNQQKSRKLFTMLFPPPNVTGDLHLGHAVTATIQDAIVRWKLMNNHRVVWVPGFDHAGIATQVVVEKKLWREQKRTRYDLGKEQFLDAVFDWKADKSQRIREQIGKLNALIDWDYEYFTMDEKINESVREAFIRLFDQGIIYRATRPINWCCSLKSAISDAEVEMLQIEKRTMLRIPNYANPVEFGLIHRLAYRVHQSDAEQGQKASDNEIVVATTRPETIFGDTALAVHPADERFRKFHGKRVINPLTNELIPIVLDASVDMSFHTGALKITPSHDTNDYETALRHQLPFKSILNDSGCLTNVPTEFMNMPRFEARAKVLDRLKAVGAWRSSADHAMTLPVCSRTGDALEPLLKEQWFARAGPLFDVCGRAVRDGSLRLVPEQRANLWHHYADVFARKDWCISRQLWWGLRIPAFRCSPQTPAATESTLEQVQPRWFAAHTQEDARAKAAAHFGLETEAIRVEQDEDVFDTWFTSTMLPLAVFGWPHALQDSDAVGRDSLYPTDLLETGFDIMFFWAFRMVGMCHTLSGKLPYSEILFHGLIRDADGRKMSKSLGNVIDPLDLIEGATLTELNKRVLESNLSDREKAQSIKQQTRTYPRGIEAIGIDAARLTLLTQDFKSDNISIDSNLFLDSKRYCNKIWQSARYFQMCVEANRRDRYRLLTLNQLLTSDHLRPVDRWMLTQLADTVDYVEKHFARQYNLHLVVKRLREFFYADLCDFYLESTKPVFKASAVLSETKADRDDNVDDVATRQRQREECVWNVMRACIAHTLRLYHPIMPSITEELWQRGNFAASNDTDSSTAASVSILDQAYPCLADFAGGPIDKHASARLDQLIQLTRLIVSTTNSLCKVAQANEWPQLFISCSHVSLSRPLTEMSDEITHLARVKQVHVSVDPASTVQSSTTHSSSGSSLRCPLSPECTVLLQFENKIDAKLLIERLEKQRDKAMAQLNTSRLKLSKLSGDPVSTELKRASIDTEMQRHTDQIEKINSQIDVFRSANVEKFNEN